ncbi:MAG: hypothetical protein ASARMPREDX12_001644 [Alectoria sarmentosa]|nr:MAG: hypothetical protein ASARMPREDX12_001644 [Alectoria sarmentosa]
MPCALHSALLPPPSLVDKPCLPLTVSFSVAVFSRTPLTPSEYAVCVQQVNLTKLETKAQESTKRATRIPQLKKDLGAVRQVTGKTPVHLLLGIDAREYDNQQNSNIKDEKEPSQKCGEVVFGARRKQATWAGQSSKYSVLTRELDRDS